MVPVLFSTSYRVCLPTKSRKQRRLAALARFHRRAKCTERRGTAHTLQSQSAARAVIIHSNRCGCEGAWWDCSGTCPAAEADRQLPPIPDGPQSDSDGPTPVFVAVGSCVNLFVISQPPVVRVSEFSWRQTYEVVIECRAKRAESAGSERTYSRTD